MIIDFFCYICNNNRVYKETFAPFWQVGYSPSVYSDCLMVRDCDICFGENLLYTKYPKFMEVKTNMKTKAKKFSKKLLALFLAVLMAVSCFAGTITSYGAIAKSSDMTYHDAEVMYNELGWTMLSDEQVATAILDYADSMLEDLAKMEPQLAARVTNLKVPTINILWNVSNHKISIRLGSLSLISVEVNIGSVNGLITTLGNVHKALHGTMASIAGAAVDLGDLTKLNLNSMNGMTREKNTSTEILRGVFKLIYDNQYALNRLFQGTLTLGTLNGALDIYGLIGGIADAPSGYQSNMIYNLVQSLIFKYTNWYTNDEKIAFRGGRPAGTTDADGNPLPEIPAKTFVFDDELLDKMTTELLANISVLVTYNQQYDKLATDESGNPIPKVDKNGKADGYEYDTELDNSATRYLKIKALMDKGKTYQDAATELGYDPNLCYTDEFVDDDGNYLNVLLFAYGNADPATGLATDATQTIALTKADSLFKFGYEALKFAWKTVLKDTVKLLHVNYNVDRGHGSNFDNEFYYYLDSNGLWTGDPTQDYTMANLEAYAKHLSWVDVKDADGNIVMNGEYPKKEQVPLYEAYGITVDPANVNAEKNIVATEDEAVALFISWIRNNYEYDRDVTKDSKIDATTITNKIRYSPIADKIFNMPTGPINLYFMQLGTPNLDAFFEDANYANYPSMVAALNDALVAAVKDIFVESDNIYGKVPTLSTVGGSDANFNTIGASQIESITSTLIGNALKVVQYTADAIDRNILKAFYDANGADATLKEDNIETAMLPLLISCIGQINIDGKLCELIHPRDWDACKDAEGIVFLALEEYLSYVLPNYDYRQLITYDDQGKINASLEDTILPMARDAVAYVMEGYVPVYDGDGNMYKVENKKPGDAGYYVNGYASGTYNKAGANDLFTLLNSVVCYYADKKAVTANGNDKGFTNGVANLLGVINGADGSSRVNVNNDLFTNINNIANRLLPVIGTLQGKGYGAADSYDLIWNKIVKGILDIGSNGGGVTNFINQFLTIVSADPIQKTPITLTVYDVLKDLLNALFGPRYTNQGWYPVPDRTTDHPFDDVLQKAVVAGTGDSNPGLIQKAIYNLIEFTGVGSSGIATYPDTLLPGVTFALLSVNSFLHFIPFLDTASINQADAKFVEGYTKSGVAASGSYTDEFIFTNKCSGINSVVINKDGSLTQNSRYAAKITAVNTSVDSTAKGKGATVTMASNWVGQVVQPDAKLTQNVTFKAPSSGEAFYSVEIVYDIVEVNNTAKVVVANQKTTGYKYITGEVSWIDAVYPSVNSFNKTYNRVGDGGYWYAEALEGGYNIKGQQSVKTSNGFAMNDAKGIGNNAAVVARTPNEIVIDKSNPGMISSLGLLVKNTSAGIFGGQRTIHGIFTYQSGVNMINDLSGNTTASIGTSSYNDGTPLFDRTTGDIIKMGRYDYSLDEGKSWVRSDANHADGFLYQEIESKLGHTNFITRPHVVFTLQEAQNAKILKAAHKNTETNLWEHVFLDATQKGSSYTYEQLCPKVSWATPIDGIYVDSFGTTDIDKDSGIYVNVLFYDGVTPLEAGKVDQKLGLHFWNQTKYGNEAGYNEVQLYVADDASKPGLQSGLEALTDCLDYYGVEDFDASLGGETVYNNAKAQLKDALKTYSIQYSSNFLTNSGLDTIADTNIELPVTSETTSTTGDEAFKPFTTSNDKDLPDEVKADAFVNNGVYYLDKNHTMPIYTNSPLTDADVTNGKDAAGYAVEKGKNGKWYLTNSAAYEQTWQKPVSGTYVHNYPVRVDLSVQKENDNGDYIYKQVQFEYRNIYNNKVNSDMQWVCKFPVSQTVLTPATRTSLQTKDYRGVYTQHRDNLDYYNEQLGEVRDTYAAESLFTGVTQTRTGLVLNNFDIVSFYRMQNAARLIERNFSVYIWHNATNEYGEVEEVEEILSPTDAIERMNYYDDQGISYTSETESKAVKYALVDYYQNYFNQYFDKLVDRSYIGDKVEKEIICTTGTDYSNIEVVSQAVIGPSLDAQGKPALNSNGNPIVDENGNPFTDSEGKAIDVIITPAVVKIKNTSGVTVPYGALDTNGNLVNEGEKVYTDYTWNIFVTDIANAVTVAQRGHDASYPAANEYYAPGTYTYDAEVSTCYTEYKDLRRAEITLIEDIPVGEGITVSGTITIANTLEGGNSGFGIVGINVMAGDTVVATSAADGTFTATVPAVTTELTITGPTTIDRTVTLTGAANLSNVVIPVCITDYNKDGFVNGTDLGLYLDYHNKDVADIPEEIQANRVYCDLSCDTFVNGTDLGLYLDFHNKTVAYDALALD